MKMEFYDVIKWEKEANEVPHIYFLSYNGEGNKELIKTTPAMVKKFYNAGTIRNIPSQVKTWLNLSNQNPYIQNIIQTSARTNGVGGGS